MRASTSLASTRLSTAQKLGSQVFASQPPGFYALLEVERAIFGGSIVSIRVGMLTLGLVGCVSAYRTQTPKGSAVASDLPIIPFYADRRQPGNLVDTSLTRIGAGWLTQAAILSSIESDRVSAVVVGHNFAADRALLAAVRLRYPRVIKRNGVDVPGEGRAALTIYLRK
jgi:hypothetical protein